MSWTYSDWRSQSTKALRLARLRLHMTEVSDKIDNEVSGHGFTEGSGSVTQYLDKLQVQCDRLEASIGESGNAVMSRVRIDRR